MVLVQFREEWNAIRDLANEAPGVELARAATRALCVVRQNFPWAFDVAATVTPGFSPALGSYGLTRWFWDRQCQDAPLPNSGRGNGGLIGGQCAGVLYTVTGIVNNANAGLPPNNVQSISLSNCLGPLRDVWIATRPGGNGRQYVLYVLDADDTVPREAIIGSDAIATPVISNPRFTISPVDNCPPNTSIPPLPVNPPPISLPITVRIGQEERTRIVNLPGLDVSNWPQFTFSPTIEIDGITFSFDVGGVNISYEGGSTTPPAPTPPDIEQEIEQVIETINNVDNTVNNIENEIENVTNTVNNINTTINNELIADLTEILNAIKCCCCEENVTYETQTIEANSPGGVFDIPSNTVAVIISGGNFDLNLIRTQAGSGSAPNVFYWGWASVNYGSANGGERIPLQFENQSLAVAEGATSVQVSPTFGATCSISVVVKEKNCNEHG